MKTDVKQPRGKGRGSLHRRVRAHWTRRQKKLAKKHGTPAEFAAEAAVAVAKYEREWADALQQVVPANKRGSSGLPVAAQRARSRQVWATLETALFYLGLAEISLSLGQYRFARKEIRVAAKVLREVVATKRRRRPLGGNAKLTDAGGEP